MRITKESRKKVKNLARKFTRNSPPLCRDHMPSGLPIDAPEHKDISEKNPSYKFEKIVENEFDKKEPNNQPICVQKSYIRMLLRTKFVEEFYSNCDEKSCILCYNNNNKSLSDSEYIRMNVPDKFKQISNN